MPDKGRTRPSFSASSIVPMGSTIIPGTIVLEASLERLNTKAPSLHTALRISCSSLLMPTSLRFATSIVGEEGFGEQVVADGSTDGSADGTTDAIADGIADGIAEGGRL